MERTHCTIVCGNVRHAPPATDAAEKQKAPLPLQRPLARADCGAVRHNACHDAPELCLLWCRGELRVICGRWER
eukprot:13860860-Alexandrium_andersonii.AAC.1